MSNNVDFPCSKCGACCRRASLVPDFPFKTNEKGWCEHLQDDNSCGIYDERPEVCRIKESFHKYESMISFEDYMLATSEICNSLQEIDDMDSEYRIDLVKLASELDTNKILNQINKKDDETKRS